MGMYLQRSNPLSVFKKLDASHALLIRYFSPFNENKYLALIVSTRVAC